MSNKEEQETAVFTLKKQVIGLEEDKEFRFTWSCFNDEGMDKLGDATLKNGDEVKAEGLPLNSTCTITELNGPVSGDKHSLTWLVDGKEKMSEAAAPAVKITPRPKGQSEVTVVAVNSYKSEKEPEPQPGPEPKPEPKTGGFTVKKKVTGLKEGEHKDKEFKFIWRCVDDTRAAVSGNAMLKNGGEVTVDGLSLDSTCVLAELNTELSDYEHSLEWFVNGKPAQGIGRNVISVDPKPKGETGVVVIAENKYTPRVPPVPPVPPVSPTTSKPAPTTTSSSKTTTPTTTSSSAAPTTTSSTTTAKPTTSASSTSSAAPTATTSTTSSAKPTTTTSSTEPIVPTTTGQFPPIIPIPIPIPVPPAPFPPAPAPAPAPAPVPAPNGGNNTPATPHHGGTNTAQPQQNNGKNTTTATPHQTNKGKGLANTGASVIWLALVALLLAAVGGFITYRSRKSKKD
ncbi:DUF5979 domain-containing protein [Corynebacterium kutscheri]|nr:DUF5979 domain-containing protein [Corynebacterium kutscheri]